MTTILNAQSGVGLTQSADGSGVLKVQSNGVTTNALAWVNFNGTGTVAIRSSYNVSSITDNGTGDYTVNFATPMSDANYAVSGSATGAGLLSNYSSLTAQTTTALRVRTSASDAGGAAYDSTYVSVAVFGN